MKQKIKIGFLAEISILTIVAGCIVAIVVGLLCWFFGKPFPAKEIVLACFIVYIIVLTMRPILKFFAEIFDTL